VLLLVAVYTCGDGSNQNNCTDCDTDYKTEITRRARVRVRARIRTRPRLFYLNVKLDSFTIAIRDKKVDSSNLLGR
jgi:hypothetical protein